MYKLQNSQKILRKMHFLAIYRPKFQTFSVRCLLWGHPMEPRSQGAKQTLKKLNLWEKTVVDKSD